MELNVTDENFVAKKKKSYRAKRRVLNLINH
jgi:hypothetical protein